jgi:hypothetical protein
VNEREDTFSNEGIHEARNYEGTNPSNMARMANQNQIPKTGGEI